MDEGSVETDLLYCAIIVILLIAVIVHMRCILWYWCANYSN